MTSLLRIHPTYEGPEGAPFDAATRRVINLALQEKSCKPGYSTSHVWECILRARLGPTTFHRDAYYANATFSLRNFIADLHATGYNLDDLLKDFRDHLAWTTYDALLPYLVPAAAPVSNVETSLRVQVADLQQAAAKRAAEDAAKLAEMAAQIARLESVHHALKLTREEERVKWSLTYQLGTLRDPVKYPNQEARVPYAFTSSVAVELRKMSTLAECHGTPVWHALSELWLKDMFIADNFLRGSALDFQAFLVQMDFNKYDLRALLKDLVKHRPTFVIPEPLRSEVFV